MPTKTNKRIKDKNDPLYGRVDLQQCLMKIAEHIELEDFYVRFQQLREVKKHNLWWSGVQQIFWSDANHDWRIPTQTEVNELSSREEIKFVYDYVINIFKPHGEAFIAALSSDLPGVIFGPDDAMNPDDIRAARLATNKAQHIQLYNDAKLIAIQALFFYFCEGFVASYRNQKSKKDYGSVNIPTFGAPQTVKHSDAYLCTNCTETTPVDMGFESCPICENPFNKDNLILGQEEEVPTRGEDIETHISRQYIEVYGLGNVKVPSYASSQEDMGYCVLYKDQHYAKYCEAYYDKYMEDSDQSIGEKIGPSGEDSYERYMRSSSVVLDGRLYQETNRELTTQKCYWIRPWMLNILGESFRDEINELKELFPSGGIYFSVIDSIFCESCDETMEDYWRFSKAGPSKGMHSDPIGKPLISINEVRNTLTNLLVQTIETGIPENFADNKVLDFDQYSASEASPGTTYPIMVPANTNASNYFYERKTATFPKEAMAFQQSLDSDAQFVIGTVPSVYGGEGEGSKTLGEYQQSRASALQRLAISSAFWNSFWRQTISLCVLKSIECQITDEKFTKPLSTNSFETVWMKTSDTIGKFSLLTQEVSGTVPVSWEDKRALLLQALGLQDPNIMQLLESADNLGTVIDLFGLSGTIRIPGEFQRTKQLQEIVELLNSTPTEGPDGSPQPSIQIETEVDTDEYHIEVCRNFLASPQGLDHKENNPAGYINVVAHLKQHLNNVAMQPVPTPILQKKGSK